MKSIFYHKITNKRFNGAAFENILHEKRIGRDIPYRNFWTRKAFLLASHIANL